VNIMDFCKKFNEKSKGQEGLILPVVLTVYEDRSFSFIIKSPPSSILLKQACGIAKASGEVGKVSAGQVTHDHVREIAKTKFKDLNANDMDAAIKIVSGTARSMGIEIVDKITAPPPAPEGKEPAKDEKKTDKAESKIDKKAEKPGNAKTK